MNNQTIEYLNDNTIKNIDKADYFKLAIIDDNYDLKEEEYSIYALLESTITIVHTDKGFDTGLNDEIISINFESISAKQFIINTNSFNTTINITSNNASIKHYGYAKEVTIDGNVNYECYATIGRLTINNGNINVMQDGFISCLMDLNQT